MPDTDDPVARWLDTSQQQAWRALIMGMTLLTDRLDADLRRGFDISLAEYEILVRLSERPERRLRMAQLADAMAHSRSRVTHTVKRMEKAGLVRRFDSEEDRRGVVCEMTEQG
jgi:DNA-binding MarR family transcriptional regulator